MRTWRWLISALIILYSTVLYANEREPVTGNTIDRLDDIVVTATKTEKRVADAPASVTVVTLPGRKRKRSSRPLQDSAHIIRTAIVSVQVTVWEIHWG